MNPPAPSPEHLRDAPTFAEELGRVLSPQDGPLPHDVLARIAGTYDWTLQRRGPTPKSVLWHNAGSQKVRFRHLLKVMDGDRFRRGLVINDLGCGYGALYGYIRWRPFMWGGRYVGYDLCPRMVRAAQARYRSPRARFLEAAEATEDADYSFASGTFGLRLDVPGDRWRDYARECLKRLAARSRRGMAFNLLNARAGDFKDTLYYADPDDWMEFCRTTFGPKVRLLDRYTPSDFTILVRL